MNFTVLLGTPNNELKKQPQVITLMIISRPINHPATKAINRSCMASPMQEGALDHQPTPFTEFCHQISAILRLL